MTKPDKLERTHEFARAVCNAWGGDCVMNESDKVLCTKSNCLVFPIALRALVRLDIACPINKEQP